MAIVIPHVKLHSQYSPFPATLVGRDRGHLFDENDQVSG